MSTLFGKRRGDRKTLSGTSTPDDGLLTSAAIPYDQRVSRQPPASTSGGGYPGHASITPPIHLINELIGPNEAQRTSSLSDTPLSPSSHSIRSVVSDGRERDRRRRDADTQSIRSFASSQDDPTATPRGSTYSNEFMMPDTTRKMRPSTSTVSSRASSALSSAPSTSSIGSHRDPTSSLSARTSRSSHASSYYTTAPAPTDDFHYPRPADDEEIERLFVDFIAKRGLDKLPASSKSGNGAQRNVVEEMLAWPPDKKWQLVHTQAANEWAASRKRSMGSNRSSSRPATSSVGPPQAAIPPMPVPSSAVSSIPGRADEASGRPPPLDGKMGAANVKRDRPEDYLAMFMDGSISAKNVASLNVGLRTYEVSWLAAFIQLQGQSVLSSSLGKLAKEGSATSETDLVLEYEIIKCLKTLLNSKYGANDAIAHPNCITNIVYSITTPHLPTRKTVADILIFLTHWDTPKGHTYVLRGFEALQKSRNAPGRFDVWLHSLEATLDGRGRMGSLVGASEEVRSLRGKEAQAMLAAVHNHGDSALNEYALSNLLLVNSLLAVPDDFEVRMSLRNQLESAGLRSIMKKMRLFSHPLLDRQLNQYDEVAEIDAAELRERMETEVLLTMTDPSQILHAILDSVHHLPRARDFFLSTLQHFLLIREEGEQRVRYFGLIDRLVTAIVLDNKALDADFSALLGVSVASVVSRFADQDRLQSAIDEAATLKATVTRMKREKEAQEEEMGQQDDGLVGQLKNRLGRTEEDLRVSRQTTRALESRMEELERQHRGAVAEQDLQTRELFNMLKEARTLELIQDDTGILDRKALMEQMEKKLQRTKTIYALEGRSVKPLPTPGRPASPSTVKTNGRMALQLPSTPQQTSDDQRSPRKSRFEDAEDEAVRRHIEESLANGSSFLSPLGELGSPASPHSPQSTRGPSRKVTPSPTFGRRGHVEPSRAGSPRGMGDDSTPLASRNKHYPNLGPTSPPSAIPGHVNGVRKGSFPSNMLDELRERTRERDGTEDGRDSFRTESGTSATTDETSLTSMASGDSPSRPAKSAKRSTGGHSRSNTLDDEDVTVSLAPPPPPPAPPPPPFVPGAPPAKISSSAPMAPPAPPMPNAPLAPSLLPSTMSSRPKTSPSFLDQIKARGESTTTVVVPAGSTVASPGSFVVPPAPPPAPFAPSAPAIFPSNIKRKEVAITARQQLKQLQWDNMPQLQINKTIWADSTDLNEDEIASLLKQEGVFAEMEEDFRAQQAKINIAKKQKAQLKSVLDMQSRQRIEITLKKASSTEVDVSARISDIASRILQFDDSLCTEPFLQEMKSILPSAEDIGKLNVYRNAPEETLAELHHADRFLVELIKVPRLNQRIEGMYYYVRFDEQYDTLTSLATRVIEACEALQSAAHFRDLLKLILLIGNFMNASGAKGGAFGFRVSSINKLVDTKAANGTTLLHTLQRTISRKFPDMDGFIDELSRPASCSKLNIEDTRKELVQLRTGLQSISKELNDNFADLDHLPADDGFAKVMWRFVREAGENLSSLVDRISLATSSFASVLSYFGEDHRPYTSSEFFGIFQEFIASYKRARSENARAAEEQAILDRRRQLNADRVQREADERAKAPADAALVDDLLTKLRDGDLKGGRAARQAARSERQQTRQTTVSVTSAPSVSGSSPTSPTSFELEDPGDIARGLLQQLQGDGFEELMSPPASAPAGSTNFSRPSRRLDYGSKHSSIASSRGESRPISPSPLSSSRPRSPPVSSSASSAA